jgi:hypothetical protein
MKKLGEIKGLHGTDFLFDFNYLLHENVLGWGGDMSLFGHIIFNN